jgi:uncharacterized protein YjbJ (UPF0337 family)
MMISSVGGVMEFRSGAPSRLFCFFTFVNGVDVNWDTIEGNWKTAKGKVREQWGKLTDDDLDVIAGKRDQLVGMIQHRYGRGKEAVEKEVALYEASHGGDAAHPHKS